MQTSNQITGGAGSLLLNVNSNARIIIFITCTVLCLTPFISPAIALLMRLIVAQFTGHPYLHLNHKATHILLQISVFGLGFGMNVHSALQAGKEGILFTIASITLRTSYYKHRNKLKKII